MNERTTVYVYRDKHGAVLYAGKTVQRQGRSAAHERTAEWWDLVVTERLYHCPTEEAALVLEKQLIQRYKPLFNLQHNPRPRMSRADYDRAEALLADRSSPEPDVRLSAVAYGHRVRVDVSSLSWLDLTGLKRLLERAPTRLVVPGNVCLGGTVSQTQLELELRDPLPEEIECELTFDRATNHNGRNGIRRPQLHLG